MARAISPNYVSEDLSDNSYNKKIDVFEDRVNGWYLNWAIHLNDQPCGHGGFAALHLAFSYFEFIEIFRRGKDSDKDSAKCFKDGLLYVFPNLKNWKDDTLNKFQKIIHKQGRCGFFHSGMAKAGIVLEDLNDAVISFDGANIYIDRRKFVNSIMGHFNEYVQQLRNETQPLLDNFLKAWDIVNS